MLKELLKFQIRSNLILKKCVFLESEKMLHSWEDSFYGLLMAGEGVEAYGKDFSLSVQHCPSID
jgi:L-fucose isomerase-like protein